MTWIFTVVHSVCAVDTVEIFPANYSDTAIRVEFFGDEIDRITEIDVLTGEVKCSLEHFCGFFLLHTMLFRWKRFRRLV